MKQTGLCDWLQKEPFRPRRPWLPNPNDADSSNWLAFAAANSTAEAMLDGDENTSRKKRGSYHRYDAKVRAKIAKLTEENGLTRGTQLAAMRL